MTIIGHTYINIGMDDLKAWRRAKNITQKQLAAEVETTQPHLSAVERGEDCSLELSARIYRRTGVRGGRFVGKSSRDIAALAKATQIMGAVQ